jgi:hypothetical protein
MIPRWRVRLLLHDAHVKAPDIPHALREREPLSWSHPVGGTWWPRSLVGWSAIRVDAY